MTLCEAEIDKTYTIKRVCGKGKISARLMNMGFTEGCAVGVAARAPYGTSVLVRLRDFTVALREDAAALIEVAEY